MVSLNTRRFLATLSVVALAFGAQAVSAQEGSKAAQDRQAIDAEAAKIVRDFRGMKGGEGAFDKAAGYAVFKVTKAGLGASGAGGRGVAVNKKTGARTYMRMGSAGVGLTVGVSRYDIVILFETAEKFAAFEKGGWDSSATAQAAAGTAGNQVSSTFFDGVAYYQIGRKGLMASADVSGTKFWVAEELNKK